MQYISIGTMGVVASQIVLGTDYFGTRIPKQEAFALMDTYVERGGNTFDTARIYGAWAPGGNGASERTIGEYIKSRGLQGKAIVCSKAAHPPLNNRAISRLSAEEIEQDVDESLRMLGTETIDLLFLHRDDVNVAVQPIIDALDNLVKKGKIRFYGASNWTGERIKKANEYAQQSGKQPFVASQIQWSIAVCNNDEDPTLVQMDKQQADFYNESGLPVFAYSSQAKGFFEKYDNDRVDEKATRRYLCEANILRYHRLKELSNQTGYSLSALSLACLLNNNRFPVFPIIGASNVQQLADSLSVMDWPEVPEQVCAWGNEI